MSTCPLCETPIGDVSDEYRIILEIEDITRSTKQFMGNESAVTRLFANRQLCTDCWDDLFDTLTQVEDD